MFLVFFSYYFLLHLHMLQEQHFRAFSILQNRKWAYFLLESYGPLYFCCDIAHTLFQRIFVVAFKHLDPLRQRIRRIKCFKALTSAAASAIPKRMHPLPSVIFNNVFDENKFFIISNLFEAVILMP